MTTIGYWLAPGGGRKCVGREEMCKGGRRCIGMEEVRKGGRAEVCGGVFFV